MNSDTSGDFYSEFDFNPETRHKRKREKIEIPSGGVPSLHTVLKRTYVKMKAVKKMLALGADIEEKIGLRQLTPLHVAVMKHGTKVVEYLLEQGADVFAVTNGGDTALHLNRWNEDISALLLMNGADCNAQNTRGETPTHIAAEFSDAVFLRNYLDFGADTSIKDDKGNTVLHRAAARSVAWEREDYVDPVFDERSKRHVVKLLLEYKTDSVWSKRDALRATNNQGLTAENLADRNSGGKDKIADMIEAALVPAEEESRRVAQTAFAMGHHERLGQASIAARLKPELMRMVLEYV